MVEVVPLTDFMHGSVHAREGHPVPFPESVAEDLERAGLVRIKTTVVVPKNEGKAADDGRGQPSSALPAAPASPMTMSPELKRGPGRPRKTDV